MIKIMIRAAMAATLIVGCAYFRSPHPGLVETQSQLVTGCEMLGTVAETANADRVSAYLARRAMINRVKARAAQLGASHIVWLHRTDASAVAQVYSCLQQEPNIEEPDSIADER